MDRRAFLTLRRRAAESSPISYAGTRRIDTGLTVYTGPWGTKEIVHLLKRTMFGAKKSDIDYFKTLSTVQAVNALLNVPATPPSPPVKHYSENDGVAAGATWVNTFSADGDVNRERINSFKSWWVGRMINQERNILEKMTLFWHNHFATETNVYGRGIFAYEHNAMLRANALGNFKTLVKLVTLDRAMLIYLNGALNVKEAPDENYARELMELFTLGKENNPNYTEPDVQAAARVLTGWTIDETTDERSFDPEKHDTGNKTFSSFFNNTVIAGQSGPTGGETELDALLDMIFAKDVEVSEFIVRKIYRWFCYYIIDANTENNVIKPLAQLFRNSNWEIKPVLDALFKSEHFFDPLNQGCLIKPPIDLYVGASREFNVSFPADSARQYEMWEHIYYEAGVIQQNIGDPPSVSGWPAYYQLPQFHEMWINNDTLPKRNIWTDTMIQQGYTRNGQTIKFDPIAFAQSLPNPGDPNALINDSLDILYRVPLSDESKTVIKRSILLANQLEDYYWTNEWTAFITNPNDAMARQIITTRLTALYKYFMNLAEYQLS
jgi:Uncharacterized protein conserved in bacteria